jgi:hypothetical protein
MIFSAEINGKDSCRLIIGGDGNGRYKRATCRKWKEGWHFNEDAEYCISDTNPTGILALYNANGRRLYYVGQTLAIQPGRTKPGIWYKPSLFSDYQYSHEADTWEDWFSDLRTSLEYQDWLKMRGYYPARIRITSLSKIDVRDMTPEQAHKEGFDSPAQYLKWWFGHYDLLKGKWYELKTPIGSEPYLKHSYKCGSIPISDRPAEIYTGLFIEFDFVEVG